MEQKEKGKYSYLLCTTRSACHSNRKTGKNLEHMTKNVIEKNDTEMIELITRKI